MGNICVSLGLALDPEKGAEAGQSQTCLPSRPVSDVPPGKAAVLVKQCSLSHSIEAQEKPEHTPWDSQMSPSECGFGCGQLFWSLLG